jgi:serine/threonine protein kinase/Tfp pilus assembly protein PilF
MSEPERQIMSLLGEAVEHSSPEERAAFLDRACAGDADRRARIEELLRAHEAAGRFLQGNRPPAEPVPPVDEPIREGPGTVIGPYKLLEQIGEGGFGVVFMAEQTQPVRRKVALKVLKPGMDTRQVVARFEAERQALAIMDHPNIATVHDGGQTDSGRPYFVMELVKGTPITEFCDRHHLPVRERLELFLSICQAVQHAHQKGIIHRDLKPSNVLVTRHDTMPIVKVIDFGVAKALAQDLTDKTLFTGIAQMIGTPLYMSPEQAGMSDLDIDTRSDIYSLGVLLYELLTGTTPFDPDRLRTAGYDEMRRIIREEDPPRPSTRLSTLGQAATTISTQRRSDPRRLSQLMRGELDWIVMTALEKDRSRRYESASAFAADVQRYLSDDPVLACPPSAWYRLRKYGRRNRALLVTALTVFVAALVAVGGIGWAMRDRAAVAEELAHNNALRREKLEDRINQGLAETQAEYERDNLPEALSRIHRIDALLAGDTIVGDAIHHRVEQWRAELGILQRLEDLGLRLSEASQLPEIDAAYAQVFLDIGIDINADPVGEAGRRIRSHLTWQRLTEALDDWANVRHDIAASLKHMSEDAVRRKQRLLRVARAVDTDEFRSQARLAGEKWDVAAAERLAGIPEVSRLPAGALRHLAMVIYYGGGQSRRDAATRLLRNVLTQRPDEFRLNVTCGLAHARMEPPRWAEAAHYRSIAVALRPKNPHIRVDLAEALFEQGKLDDAVAECREAINLDANCAGAHSNLGAALTNQGKVDEAMAECRKTIELDPKRASAHTNLGLNLKRKGQLDKAAAEYRKALELDPKSATAHLNLGAFLFDCQHDCDGAIVELQKAIAIDPNSVAAHYNLGAALSGQGKWDEALAAYREAIRIKQDQAEPHFGLAVTLLRLKNLDEGIAELQKAIVLKPDSPLAHGWLGEALKMKGQFREALKEYREGHELGSKDPSWRYPSAESMRQCERLIERDEKLRTFLEGRAKPASPAEGIELAGVCSLKRLNRAAVRFYEEAFAAEPKLVIPNRYNAACAAARAGCGLGKDADQLDDQGRARLRRQALDWLRADLHAKGLLLDKDSNNDGPAVLAQMRLWPADPDFSGVRGPEALAKLPEAERQPWQKLWTDVANLVNRARGKTAPDKN